jgi:class 3 adenylate cyclase/tetratricopeptide (TPR) repeat protein
MDTPPQTTAPLVLVFTDMVGSTAAKRNTLGDTASSRDRAYLEAIQSKHLRVVRAAVAEHNGTEIMTIGDSFFLTFEDITDAIRCAAEIQHTLRATPIITPTGPLQLRIGIHIGSPEFFENSWHGIDVDTAARVQSVGSGQQIVLSKVAREAAGDMAGITFRPLGTFALKGVGNVPIYDADYDHHGLREPQAVSVGAQRRNAILSRGLAAIAILIIVAGAAFFLYQRHKESQQASTPTTSAQKDSIILADLVNKTGDPVFDTTLTQAMAIQLEQSPVLNLISQQHLHQSLQYMGKPATDLITPEIAREIGQREGIKAYLSGEVAKIGSSYLVTLTAQNTNNGDTIASEQAQAPDKDHVLDAVGKVTVQMRSRLGESLASIQKLDTPFGQATTSSLEAFRSFALGDVEHEKGFDFPEAEGHYRQAVELDPSFAMAWARLGVVYTSSQQRGKALAAFTKAFELSKNVSERERLYIQAHYYTNATGELEKAVETLELSVKTYPLDLSAPINLAFAQGLLGDFEDALANDQKAATLDPTDAVALSNIFGLLESLDRFDEAAKTYTNTQRLHVADGTAILQYAYQLYFFQNDHAGMNQVTAKGEGRADQYVFTQTVAQVDEFTGSYRKAEADWNESAREADAQKAHDAQANSLLSLVSGRAIAGFCTDAPKEVRAALALDKSKATLVQAAFAAALCNDHADAEPILTKLGRDYPEDTVVQKVTIPQSRAAMAIFDHQPAVAIQDLEVSKSFVLVSDGAYLRGLAYLDLHDAPHAIDAFQRASKFKGACLQALQDYGQARLGLARAYALAGDRANAKKTYADLLTLWHSADPDLPQLLAAKKEFAAL